MESVLVTGAGAPGAFGVITSLTNNSFNVVGCDVNSDVVGAVLCDAFFKSLLPSDKYYIQHLLEACKKHNIKYIIPLVTNELEILSINKEIYAENGIIVCVSNYNEIEILNNKYLFLNHLHQNSIQKDGFILASNKFELSNAIDSFGYPDRSVVVKPAKGNGSRGVRVLEYKFDEYEALMHQKPGTIRTTKENYLRIISAKHIPDLLVSEFYPGKEVTVDALFYQGKIIVSTIRTRDTIRSGISTSGTFIEASEIDEKINLLAETMPELNGLIGFQMKQDENDDFKFIECNPRIQGTSIAATCLGINYPLLHLDSLEVI